MPSSLCLRSHSQAAAAPSDAQLIVQGFAKTKLYGLYPVEASG